ncbi:MAG: HDOD domain-containing protein [Methylococcales bacterium]|nr:HDOD domain-containing protein [Methylococcales bacterium]
MVSISSFFKGKKDTTSLEGEDISLDKLKQLIPIRNLSEEKLKSFAFEKKAETLPAGKTLFTINDSSDSAIYLLDGTVSISDENNKSYDVESAEAKARFPLTSGIKHTTTAIAKSNISFLRVSQKIMSLNSDSSPSFELIIPDELKDCQLLQSFAQHFIDNEIEIPSLPIIATKLSEAMKKDIGIEEAVKIVQLDPVIAAKLIEVANCPLYISVVPAKSCFEAVNRIGLNATRNLVISLSVKNIFTGRLPAITKYLDTLWKESLYLSGLSFVLASISKQKIPEEALLAGLTCDIGVIPFLNFISNLPKDFYTEEDIIKSIPVVKGIVGASILKKWDFPEEFIQVPLRSNDWFQHTEDSLTFADIVVLSRLHSKIGKKETADLPAIISIPAASKLTNISLSPENTLNILHDAKEKIKDALKTFSI